MFKKPLAAACLMITAVSASSSTEDQSYSFMVTPGKGKPFIVERTLDGIIKIETGMRKEPKPQKRISLTRDKPQPGEDEDIEVNATLTPRSVKKALEQVGTVSDFTPGLPFDLASCVLDSEFQTYQPTMPKPTMLPSNDHLVNKASFSEADKKRMQKFIEEAQNHYQQPATLQIYHECIHSTATGTEQAYDVTREKPWLDKLQNLLPNLDVRVFEGWYRSQHKGTIAGMNGDALTNYIRMGVEIRKGNISVLPKDFQNGRLQTFDPTLASMMIERLKPGFQMPPLSDGEIDTLSLLGMERHFADFSVQKKTTVQQ